MLSRCGRWREWQAAREVAEEQKFQNWLKHPAHPTKDPAWEGSSWTGQIEVPPPPPPPPQSTHGEPATLIRHAHLIQTLRK